MAHLLLIDDNPALIPGQVRQAFPAPAHRVEVAGTGAEGLERVGAGLPDVILLDLGLPDQSGLEVYQQIRRIDARIPVIFVTMAKGPTPPSRRCGRAATTTCSSRLTRASCGRWSARRWRWPGRCASRPWFPRPSRTPTWTASSSAAARPCARCTRPLAASRPRTSRS